MTTTTELTLPQRAAVALGAAEHEKQLILLVEESKTITEIKNPDGRTQCHAAYMRLKNSRCNINNLVDDATEDAKKFTKAVKAEAVRLIAITQAEEDRLQGLRDAWDEKIAAEKAAKIKAEQERVAAIRERIESVRAMPLHAVGRSAKEISQMIFQLSVEPVYDSYQEFAEEFKVVRLDALNKLAKAETAQRNADIEADRQRQEAVRIQAEREELARLRAENEARRAEAEAKAKAEREAAEAELQAARDKHNAEMAAQRAELERQQQEVARQQAEIRRQKEATEAAEREKAAAAHAASIVQDVAPRAQEALAEEPARQTLKPHPAWPFPTENAKSVCQADAPPTLRLGQIGERLGFAVSAEFLRELGFEHACKERSAFLYHERDFDNICTALIDRIERARAEHRMAEAA